LRKCNWTRDFDYILPFRIERLRRVCTKPQYLLIIQFGSGSLNLLGNKITAGSLKYSFEIEVKQRLIINHFAQPECGVPCVFL